MELTNIFKDDAFTMASLTQYLNSQDHIPGRAGDLAFAGVGEGVPTDTVMIEADATSLTLIQTSQRGAPSEKEKDSKATMRAIVVPHIQLEETFQASAFQGVRQLGSASLIAGPQAIINKQLNKMAGRHDLTLEHLRLGALQGLVKDADGTTLVDLYTFFGIQAPDPVSFLDVLTGETTELPFVRTKCHEVQRQMQRTAKLAWPGSAQVWAFCGDNFFDRLVESSSVRATVAATDAARAVLGNSYVNGVISFGGVMWENYRGTDDNSTVAIDTDECRFFPVGVPGLYAEYFAPADFMECVNTIGLPRYAKVAADDRFNRFVEVHTQQNPLPLCVRPQVLMRGTLATE